MPDWEPPNKEHPPPKPGEPPLHHAARTGDHDAIRAVIRSGVDVNGAFDIALDPGARACPATALMVAAGSGDGATIDTVRLLLSLGADARRTTDAGSAAAFAARGLGWNYRPGGDAARLDALLLADSPLELAGDRGLRLVCETAALGDAGRLAILIQRGAPANPAFDAESARRSYQGLIAGIRLEKRLGSLAAQLPEGVKEVLDGTFANIEREMAERATAGPSAFEIPLFQAAESGSGECVRLLLEAGASPRQRDNDASTALFHAGSADVVTTLVAAGCEMDVVSQWGRDALQHALEEVTPETVDRTRSVVTALLRAGLSLQWTNKHGWTRLQQAAFAENLAAVRCLLELGHAVEPDAHGTTALHQLCWHWDHGDERDDATREMVSLLIRAGVPVNASDAEGNTPLHEAVAGDGANVVAVQELLKHGADPNARNNEGLTPLAFLYENHFEYAKLVPALIGGGANPLIKDNRGLTAIDLARARAAGEEPGWRKAQWADSGGPPCGWKPPAEQGGSEWEMIELMERAARRFSGA